MSIKPDFRELQSIKNELNELRLRAKKLREKQAQVEERIRKYLNLKGTPGVKCEGLALILTEKEVAGPKPRKKKDEDAMIILEKHGISNPIKVLEEIMSARKGSPKPKQQLKIQKIKQSKV